MKSIEQNVLLKYLGWCMKEILDTAEVLYTWCFLFTEPVTNPYLKRISILRISSLNTVTHTISLFFLVKTETLTISNFGPFFVESITNR
jgi:hypothetical protein